MTSHVLLEGFLHVKDPRGSEDRKFWKAWRRQWVSFSVIYPSGRRDPHLLLNLSHSSSETPERQVRVQREGLRIFRCRSKSRPFRTWAIMSGSKLVLYFAAESEIEAQNWMKELRDGLWPPCFSFEMLTACSYEVSLIDDENTFLSGLLGVYGRFVLTSGDVISLMHPYWGCTLLQIPLSRVHEVVFVREAEIQPAGVFSILMKRDEEFKIKALQFFCNTAMDAIQWILNKIHTKYSEMGNKGLKYNLPMEPSTLVLDDTSCKTENLEFQSTGSALLNPPFSDTCSHINAVPINNDYENLQYLKINSTFNSRDCISIPTTVECSLQGKLNDFKDSEKDISWKPAATINLPTHVETENEDSQYSSKKLSNTKLKEDNFYANYSTTVDSTIVESQIYSIDNVNNVTVSETSNTKYKLTSKSGTGLKQNLAPANDISNVGIYSAVNKKNVASKTLCNEILNKKFSMNELSNAESVINNHLSEPSDPKLDDIVLSSKSEYKEIDCHVATLTNSLVSDHLSASLKTKHKIPVNFNNDFLLKDNAQTIHSLYDSNCPAFEIVKKQISSQRGLKTKPNVQFPTTSLSSNKCLQKETNQLLPNISSDVLNTSCRNSMNYEDKANKDCLLYDEEDPGTLQWVIDEFINLDIEEGIYEDILDRRGTVYEEIDSSESDNEDTFQEPPSLPKRPKNLDIPNSLRLQKLSNSIKQTLETSDRPLSPTTKYPVFIKKIKDVSRIMQITPTLESSRESFTLERKLPLHIEKNTFVLKPFSNSPQVSNE